MIQLEHVSKIYERGGSRVTALDDASLEIERGEFVSLAGVRHRMSPQPQRSRHGRRHRFRLLLHFGLCDVSRMG